MSQVLFYGSVAWFYVKFMAHNAWWYARHLFRRKSEDVTEFSDGSQDILFYRLWKFFSYLDRLPLTHLYLLISFNRVRPFMCARVVHVYTHDGWRLFFPFSFVGDDGSSSFQSVDEALAGCYLVSFKNTHLSVVLFKLQ